MFTSLKKQTEYLLRYEWFWLVILIVSSVLLRFFSFFPSELDHDESTYAIIGNELLKGKALYRDVTDTKPLGIFMVYAGLQYVFAYSIFAKRLFAAIVVGATAFMVRKVTFYLLNDQKSANAAAWIYLIYSSTWLHFGLSPNTELYFNFFTILSLFFFMKKGTLSLFFAGIMAGVGFMFKYLVLLDFVAFGLFFLYFDMVTKRLNLKRFFDFVLAGFGFLLPFGLSAFVFYMKGLFNDFYFISFVVPGNYSESESLIPYLAMLGDFIGRFLPLSIIVFIGAIHGLKQNEKRLPLFFAMWVIMVLIAMYLPGKGFLHYTIQLMLPFSIIAGAAFRKDLKLNRFSNRIVNESWLKWTLPVVLIVIQLFSFKQNYLYYDHQRQVAGYLADNLGENETVFISNYEPIIYYLLKQDPPSKYVHSNLIFTDLHQAFEFDNLKEIKRIMNDEPQFVVTQDNNELMEPFLENEYVLDTLFRNNRIQVYRRNN